MRNSLVAIGLAFAVLILASGCTTPTPPVSCINVTCNGVTNCYPLNHIPPCAPVPPSNSSTTPTSTCINVTCNGVTSCYPPDNVPPCAPTINSTEQNGTCPDGYICGNQSNGCAVPGAIYNCPSMPINPPPNVTTEAVNLTQELNNSAQAGFSLIAYKFSATSAENCTKELISPCDNNMPSQFICINSLWAAQVTSQYSSIYSAKEACPLFFQSGTVSCGVDNGYCVVESQGAYAQPA